MSPTTDILCPRCAEPVPNPLGSTSANVWFMCPACGLPFHIGDRRLPDGKQRPPRPWLGPDRRRPGKG